MKTWWQQLNQREQQLISLMSVIVIIFGVYQFIWQPMNDNIAKTQTKIKRQSTLLTWVVENTQRYTLAKSQGMSKATDSLSSIVNRTSKIKGIDINRMQPQGDDLQVWIEEIPFNQLLEWLTMLSQDYGLKVTNIDLTKNEQQGVVQVRRLQLGKN